MTKKNKITFIAPGLAVTGFMNPVTLSIVRTMGFASIINLMPQAASVIEDIAEKDLASKVRSFGLEYRRCSGSRPVSRDAALISEVEEALKEAPTPAIIFSRTGRRALTVWALVMRDVLSPGEIDSAAARAGHDLTDVVNQYTLKLRAA